MSKTITQPTRTKQYRALLAAFDGDKDAAMQAYLAHNAPAPKPADDPVAAKAKKPKKGKKGKAAKALTVKEQVEALVVDRGFEFTRGRVYVTGEIVEASVRVLKGGKPEIVRTSGTGRVSAVAIFATDSGDCALQNLVG